MNVKNTGDNEPQRAYTSRPDTKEIKFHKPSEISAWKAVNGHSTNDISRLSPSRKQ